MESVEAPSFSKEAVKTIDLSLCIICQTEKGECLVERPNAHEKVLKFIEEWATYGHLSYSESWSKLKNISLNELQEKQASWHRSCYQNVAHTGMLSRAKERYKRALAGPDESRRKSRDQSEESTQMTRSKTSPYNKDACFFCEEPAGYRESLHNVSTFSAGESLRSAIELSGNDKLRVKISTAVDVKDAHAIDIKYHKKCWANNVTSALRKSSTSSTESNIALASEIAGQIEFLTLTEINLKEGSIMSMAELQAAFENVLKANNAVDTKCSRRALKQLIQSEIPGVEFHKPKRVNESERVSIKKIRDEAIQLSEEVHKDCAEEMKTIFDAACLLRKAINKCKRWVFTGSLEDSCRDNLPEELYSFFRWVVQGPNTQLTGDEKSEEVHRRALSLSQTTVSLCLTERQVKNPKSEVFKSAREMPQQLAVGLAVHQAIRSKEIVNLLHGFGMSVEYNRLLRVEAQIERSVLKRMEQEDGLFLPPDIVKGRHVFFAVDNVDFAEDTHDGKCTLHGTAMAIYQKSEPDDKKPELRLEDPAKQSRSIKDLPESLTTLLECPKPAPCPATPLHPSFGLFSENEIPIKVSLQDFAWLLARNLTSTPANGEHEASSEETNSDRSIVPESATRVQVPVWSAFNSLVSDTMPVTRAGAPPLIAAPPHEWNTLLTVLMQAQKINAKVVGTDRKTVISLDMGLYQPAKKLQMSRNDLNNLVLRPGELHIVMAQLRTIGNFIENSGIDACWVEAELYGPTTVKQILDGNHVNRGESAHTITLQVLFNLYQEAFFQNDSQSHQNLEKAAQELADACAKGKKKAIEEANAKMINVLESSQILKKMSEFDAEHNDKATFKVMCHYMQMVMEMLVFIRAVRTGDWELHLKALETFTKYFFAHDRLNYARMIPLYLAEMASLKESDPEIFEEFLQGNWVVNKNEEVPFCALGADHALEHINRSMKVSGGLVGITLNPSARTKFFLIAPEMARLAGEAKDMAGMCSQAQRQHHKLSAAVLSREEKNIEALTNTVSSFTNPFTEESNDLLNIVTKLVMPDKMKADLCRQSEIGQKLFETFVKERIQSERVKLWSPMKKCKLLTFKKSGKKLKVRAEDKVVELQEDRSLFARMMMVCKSRPEINIQEAIGKYEFSVVPRSMFSADGTMLHCSAKSALMHILEKLRNDGGQTCTTTASQMGTQVQLKVCIVDAMAEVQSLSKPDWIRNCSQLAEHFCKHITLKFSAFDEIRLIFDRYDVPLSLKSATRFRRQGGQDPVYYRITNSTHIAKVSMRRLLSDTRTKMELTTYLSEKVLEDAERNGKRLVVAWGSHCRATQKDMAHLQSNQEEADTKILLHALDATSDGATEVQIHSPDTDVFVLSLRRYSELCHNTSFVTGTGQHHRVIKLNPIVDALGNAKTAALPAFHALSGADNTGSFSGKGKQTCWKTFLEADEPVTEALASLGTTETPSAETLCSIEKFICQLYVPNTSISEVAKLRWWLFRKKQAQSEKLPPTQDALKEAVLRAHYQVMVWNNDRVPNPELPSPQDYGWEMEANEWVPVMTTLPPAPEAIIHLVKCSCAKERCSNNRCQCRKAGLTCTDLCTCSDSEELCSNKQEEDKEPDESDYEYDSDDSDDN